MVTIGLFYIPPALGGNYDMVKLIIDNFKDQIDIMLLDYCNKPQWYDSFLHFDQKSFKDLFLPLLLNRDKSKDPYGLTPLHIAYLFRTKNTHVTYLLLK